MRILSAAAAEPERGRVSSRAGQTAAGMAMATAAAAAAVVRGVIYSRLPCPQMKERGREGDRGRGKGGREEERREGSDKRTNERTERGPILSLSMMWKGP